MCSDAVVPVLAAIVVDAVVPSVMAHLVLTLVMVRRIIAAAARLGDGRYREGTGDGKCSQTSRVTGVHVGIPPRGVAM